MMGSTAFWEKWKTGAGDENIVWRFCATLLEWLKTSIAEIATTNSSRQFGREEEKE
jgi:hypothetical protein